MTREIERAGIPVVHVCTMVNVALAVGSNRILPAQSVLHPTGSPERGADEEQRLRSRMVAAALAGLGRQLVQAAVLEVS